MKLSWEAISDESVPVAVAREKNKPTSYRIVYLSPTKEGEEEDASAYVSTGASSSNEPPPAKRSRNSMGDTEGVSRLSLPVGGAWEFEPVPPPPPDDESGKVKREVLLVTGRSGCGKSYWIRSYVRNYLRLYPKNAVYLLSSLTFDDTLDEVTEIKRIDLDKLVASPPKDVKTWKDSLVIIDDVEGLDAVKAGAVQRVQDMIASEGRHEATTLIRAAHNSTDYKKTRLLLNEAHAFVVYPRSGSTNQVEYLLKQYAGLDKKSVAGVLAMPARWVVLHHSEPRYYLTPTTISLMT